MRLVILLIGALLYPSVSVAQKQGQYIKLSDDSDWWSFGNRNYHIPDIKPLDKDLAADNFSIAGFLLDLDDPEPLRAASRKFGEGVVVAHGDAGTAREQICYVSSHNPNIRLIFEGGELHLAFYLFTGGQPWNGENLCTKSHDVTEALQTSSGLRLGMSRADLERILGEPDFSDGARLVYVREVKKAFSVADLTRIRKSHPEIPENEFKELEKHNSYFLEIYIEARFTNARLNYLAVLRGRSDTGTN